MRRRGRGADGGRNEMDFLLSKLLMPGTMRLDAVIKGQK